MCFSLPVANGQEQQITLSFEKQLPWLFTALLSAFLLHTEIQLANRHVSVLHLPSQIPQAPSLGSVVCHGAQEVVQPVAAQLLVTDSFRGAGALVEPPKHQGEESQGDGPCLKEWRPSEKPEGSLATACTHRNIGQL